jgi:hypothetical protein
VTDQAGGQPVFIGAVTASGWGLLHLPETSKSAVPVAWYLAVGTAVVAREKKAIDLPAIDVADPPFGRFGGTGADRRS